MLTSNEKGNVAEAAIALEAIKLGIDVLKPLAEHGRYDLLWISADGCFECSANGAPRPEAGRCLRAPRAASRLTPNGYVTSTYSAEEVDCGSRVLRTR